MTNIFKLLETKRSHVKTYKPEIPPKEEIHDAVWKAWKTSPSKNNAMAYEVLIWGHDKKVEKEKIHSLCVKNHKSAEDRAVEKDLATKTQQGKPNPYYEHIRYNPYLLTIHSRLASPNKFYKRLIEEGHFYDQSYQSYVNRIIDSVAVEVGLFAQNFTNYILEKNIDVTYNSCFVRDPTVWHDIGLTSVEQRPILMITCGYAERYRKQDLTEWKVENEDVKPNFEEVVRWV
jgi:hypothetical protein